MADAVQDEAPEGEGGTAPKRRWTRWLLGGLAAFLLLIVAAAALLNTSLGERFLADRIAAQTLPNGLNIKIGRIEGDLYGAAVLNDVTLSDPQGPFMTIPRAEVDWNPGAWLSYKLDVDTFVAQRARLERQFIAMEQALASLQNQQSALASLQG